MKAPQPLLGQDLLEYLDAHTHTYLSENFRVVKRPLLCFKKAYETSAGARAIVNLSLPVGTIIHHRRRLILRGSEDIVHYKMRASRARVHSVVVSRSRRKAEAAFSGNDPNFLYRTGDLVHPRFAFSQFDETCASGIHFFLNLKHALDY